MDQINLSCYTFTTLAHVLLNHLDKPFSLDVRVHRVQRTDAYGAIILLLRDADLFINGFVQIEVAGQKGLEMASGLTRESLIRVFGTISHIKADNGVALQSIPAMEIHNLTVRAEAIETLAKDPVPHLLPNSKMDIRDVAVETRLNNRILDVRVAPTTAIFRLISAMHQLSSEYLAARGFDWTHTPKLISYNVPGDNDYFELPYSNGRTARLTQTSEVHMAMTLCAGLKRMYDIHTVFRREKVIDSRHLAEFTLVEVGQVLDHDWTEVLETAERLIIFIVRSMQHRHKTQWLLSLCSELYPLANAFRLVTTDDERLIRITFRKAKEILCERLGFDVEDTADLTKDEEKALGQHIASAESCLGDPSDIFVITHFPQAIRPFSFMPFESDSLLTKSFDIIVRGQECVSGAQVIHSFVRWREWMASHQPPINPDAPEWRPYMAAMEAGMPPWGGFALGLNRFAQGFLGLENIHETVLWPRDSGRLEP